MAFSLSIPLIHSHHGIVYNIIHPPLLTVSDPSMRTSKSSIAMLEAAGGVGEAGSHANGQGTAMEEHSQPQHPLTIVIKLGSSSIVNEDDFQPQLALLSSIVETVCNLRRKGHRVVLVSSGAIAMGLKRMEMRVKPKVLAEKQVGGMILTLYCISIQRS